MTSNPAKSAEPAEIMARRRKPRFDELSSFDQDKVLQLCIEQIAALEAAGYRIVHPERVTEGMASAAGEEVLAQYSACMHWEEAKDVVEGLDDASVISVAIAAAPTYATPAAPQKE